MKYAVVTGGTRGIGRGICQLLLSRGYTVVASYAKDSAAAEEFIASLSGDLAERLLLVQADQSDRRHTYRLAAFVREHCPTVDTLVCNAGTTARKPFEELADADWDAVMETSVNSHFILVRELKALIPHGSRILFTGSLMALHPHATSLPYAVAKTAVHAMAKNLVKEFAGTGTTVNAIAPGFVDTDWQKKKPSEIRASICSKTAAGRFASVEETVEAFAFCLDNAFVNGTVLEISGGYSFR